MLQQSHRSVALQKLTNRDTDGFFTGKYGAFAPAGQVGKADFVGV